MRNSASGEDALVERTFRKCDNPVTGESFEFAD